MNSALQKAILVVEDDDISREATRNILRRAGFSVLCARDFHDAIELVESDVKIDVALVDVIMPTGTPHGICFVRMANQRRPELKVIFMSSRTDLQSLALLDEDEAFLHKPFEPTDLVELVTARCSAQSGIAQANVTRS
jgi:two-component system, sensor histidine kinase ChiS